MTRARDISRLLGRTDNEVDSEGEIIGTAGQIVDSAYILSQTPSSTGFTFYSTLDSLPSNADEGSLAFVEANTRMYLNDGSGWYSIAAVNLSPSLSLSPSGAIELATDGSASTVTITATDTDDPSAILSYSVESDGNMKATGTTVTQDSSVFTITPITQASGGVAGNFTLSFKVSDQIDEAVANKSFSLTFQSTGTLTSSVTNVNEGSSVVFSLPVNGYSNGYTFPYSISGIQAADITQSTSGNMVVSGNYATATITTVADLTTEGAQTMTFSADGQSKAVTINDTSLTPPNAQGTFLATSNSQSSGTSHYFYRFPDFGTTHANNVVIAAAVSWRSNQTVTISNAYLGSTAMTIEQQSRGDVGSAIVWANYTSTANRIQIVMSNNTENCSIAAHRIVNTPTKFYSNKKSWYQTSNTQSLGMYTRTGGDKGFYMVMAGASTGWLNSTVSASTAAWGSNLTESNEWGLPAGGSGYDTAVLTGAYGNFSGGSGWSTNFGTSWNPGGNSEGTMVGVVFS